MFQVTLETFMGLAMLTNMKTDTVGGSLHLQILYTSNLIQLWLPYLFHYF